MKYQIVGKNIVVTDAIRNALEKKLSRMNKYFVIDNDIDCRAVVSKIRSTAKVEVTIFTKHMIFRAEESDADLYAAFDKAIDSLEGQMRKLKTRLSRRNRVGLGKQLLKLLPLIISKTQLLMKLKTKSYGLNQSI